MTLYRYGGFFYAEDDSGGGWVALLGSSEWTKDQLEKVAANTTDETQNAEIQKALAELPDDNVPPKRGQRRRPQPAEGNCE